MFYIYLHTSKFDKIFILIDFIFMSEIMGFFT